VQAVPHALKHKLQDKRNLLKQHFIESLRSGKIAEVSQKIQESAFASVAECRLTVATLSQIEMEREELRPAVYKAFSEARLSGDLAAKVMDLRNASIAEYMEREWDWDNVIRQYLCSSAQQLLSMASSGYRVAFNIFGDAEQILFRVIVRRAEDAHLYANDLSFIGVDGNLYYLLYRLKLRHDETLQLNETGLEREVCLKYDVYRVWTGVAGVGFVSGLLADGLKADGDVRLNHGMSPKIGDVSIFSGNDGSSKKIETSPLKRHGITIDLKEDKICGTPIHSWLKNHGLFHDIPPAVNDYEEQDARRFASFIYSLTTPQIIEKLIEFAAQLGQEERMNKSLQGRHIKKSLYPLILWMARSIHVTLEKQRHTGKLFAAIDLTGMRLIDMPIWPVDERGNILEDLLDWMSSKNRAPPLDYYNAKKISLRQLSSQEVKPQQLDLFYEPVQGHQLSVLGLYRDSLITAFSAVLVAFALYHFAGLPLLGLGVFIYFILSALKFLILGRQIFEPMYAAKFRKIMEFEDLGEAEALRKARRLAYLKPIATHRGYTFHEAFELIEKRYVKDTVLLHESFPNHFLGMLALLPVVGKWIIAPLYSLYIKFRGVDLADICGVVERCINGIKLLTDVVPREIKPQ